MRPQQTPASQVRQSSYDWSLAPRSFHIQTRYTDQWAARHTVCMSISIYMAACTMYIMLILRCRPHMEARMHSLSARLAAEQWGSLTGSAGGKRAGSIQQVSGALAACASCSCRCLSTTSSDRNAPKHRERPTDLHRAGCCYMMLVTILLGAFRPAVLAPMPRS